MKANPNDFPKPWAFDSGVNDYGFYQVLSFDGAELTFRWLPPGEFIMGSPDDEPRRSVDERQRQVIFTEGFWIADTVITQEFFRNVMGFNPSHFKGDTLPVENVNIDDWDILIHILNTLLRGASFTIPTEAQWEYACRSAGTSTTPFSFGNTITPEQANYDGNYPYPGGAIGLNGAITCPVKSSPCNQVGLHEMHGNTREICHRSESSTNTYQIFDPITYTSDSHYYITRGGSWKDTATILRSANRADYSSSLCSSSIGLRLSFGGRLRKVPEHMTKEEERRFNDRFYIDLDFESRNYKSSYTPVKTDHDKMRDYAQKIKALSVEEDRLHPDLMELIKTEEFPAQALLDKAVEFSKTRCDKSSLYGSSLIMTIIKGHAEKLEKNKVWKP